MPAEARPCRHRGTSPGRPRAERAAAPCRPACGAAARHAAGIGQMTRPERAHGLAVSPRFALPSTRRVARVIVRAEASTVARFGVRETDAFLISARLARASLLKC